MEANCTKKSSAGAYVQKDGFDDSWYVVPLCDEHNKKCATLTLIASAKLVSAKLSETCGK
jgi:hypothetical protein